MSSLVEVRRCESDSIPGSSAFWSIMHKKSSELRVNHLLLSLSALVAMKTLCTRNQHTSPKWLCSTVSRKHHPIIPVENVAFRLQVHLWFLEMFKVQWEAEPSALRLSLLKTATSLGSGDRHLLYFNIDFILSFLIKGCKWLSLLKDLPWCTQHSPLFTPVINI